MKYKRNSGRKPEKEKKLRSGEIEITEDLKERVINQMVSDAEWVSKLNTNKKYSKEWIQDVMLELLMQCMGKKDILTTNMFGQQIVARMFKQQGAIQVASILAKMEGHLFDVVKGTIKQTGEIEHKHQHEVKLLPEVEPLSLEAIAEDDDKES